MTTGRADDKPFDGYSDLLTGQLSEVEIELAVAGFAALWNDNAVRPERLVPRAASSAREVAATLVQRGGAELDDRGRLVGIHGLTLRPTRHHFEHNGRLHHTWCAFDAVAIPGALGITAVAYSDCPSCRDQLRVDIRGGVPTDKTLVLWLPMMTSGNHLMSDFCVSADVFCSLDHLQRHIDTGATPGEVIDLATTAALGRDIWSDVADAPLAPDTAPR